MALLLCPSPGSAELVHGVQVVCMKCPLYVPFSCGPNARCSSFQLTWDLFRDNLWIFTRLWRLLSTQVPHSNQAASLSPCCTAHGAPCVWSCCSVSSLETSWTPVDGAEGFPLASCTGHWAICLDSFLSTPGNREAYIESVGLQHLPYSFRNACGGSHCSFSLCFLISILSLLRSLYSWPWPTHASTVLEWGSLTRVRLQVCSCSISCVSCCCFEWCYGNVSIWCSWNVSMSVFLFDPCHFWILLEMARKQTSLSHWQCISEWHRNEVTKCFAYMWSAGAQ